MSYLSLFLALPVKEMVLYAALGVSALIYLCFWLWAMWHAGSTPHSTLWQRVFWVGAILVNPITAVWYWYIWKRWAFWLLFTPLLVAFVLLPVVVHSALNSNDQTALTDLLFALGNPLFVITASALAIFPLLIRLAALLHLGKNAELTGLDRNDWIMGLALPLFGYAAGVVYCAKYLRGWAIASLLWWILMSVSIRPLVTSVVQATLTAGELRRELYNKRA